VALVDHGNGAASGMGSPRGTFTPTLFTDPSSLFRLNTGAGSDAVNLMRTAPTTATYVIDGGAGANMLSVDFTAVAGPATTYLTQNAVVSSQLGSPVYYQA